MNGWLTRLCIAGSLTLLMAWPSWAQGPPQPQPTAPPGSSAPAGSNSRQPTTPPMQTPSFVYGRVALENGQPVPESISVRLRCGMKLMQTVHTDLAGNFRFILGAGPESNSLDMGDSSDTPVLQEASPMNSRVGLPRVDDPAPRLWGCEVEIPVSGYQPLSRPITSVASVGGIDVGTFVLTRIAAVPGAAVSVTSLLAPKNARKEFEKGEKDARNKHLDSATKHLERAVAEYGAYAVAWNDLGQIYAAGQHPEEARRAFAKAITADPQYIPPCMGLAQLELQHGRYEDAIEAAGRALKLYPGSAIASFIQAVANLRLNRLDAAEKSARDAENGPHQNIPQVHVLRADIFLRKQDYSNAAAQMQAYLKESPQGEFAAEIKERLEQIEKLTADAGSPRLGPETQPQASPKSHASSSQGIGSATLRVCLRLQDDSPFLGSAKVRLIPTEGSEVVVTPTGYGGEAVFDNMLPGTYTVEASAPGFLAIRKQTDMEAGGRLQTLFLIMKPMPLPAGEAQLSMAVAAPVAPANLGRTAWNPPDIDSVVPNVEAGIACPLPQVVRGAGGRMRDLVENLQRFDATEHVEHFNVNRTGSRGAPETRTFDYVVTVRLSNAGVFQLDEYRNGSLDLSKFPAKIATTGLPAMALIFHPRLVSGFNLTCEGLGQWDGHPAWQIHFAQRPDQPNRIRDYMVGGNLYAIPLKGRAWIDAATYQVLRLETELMKPVREIALTQEHIIVDYGPVQFQTRKQRLWLPLDAEVYSEWGGRRFYRRHTFSNFKVFEVESAQQIEAPKQSYCFSNANDHDIAGILTVSPISGASAEAVSIRFTIPSGRSVCKLVGPGRDVSIPVAEVGSAALRYSGPPGSITAEANLIHGSVLDLVPEPNSAPAP